MVPAHPGEPQCIAVFRALQIGDMLVAVPALRALRRAYPHAHITLIGLPWARDFVERFGYCDELLEFPGFPGLPEREPDAQALPAFYAAARARRFDLALQMHGSGRLTNALMVELGARSVAGFRPAQEGTPAHFLPWQPQQSELHRYLDLMSAIGVPLQGEYLEFPIHPAERQEANRLLRRHFPLAAAPYVCVHPGARLPSRRWPTERFAAVADALARRGYTIVLTGGAEEAAVGDQVCASMHRAAVNLIGRTSLGAFAALFHGAHLVICNDTSASHVASAMRTPSVVISSAAEVARWRPLNRTRHRVLWHDTACRPCEHATCPTGHECALGVEVDAVIGTACDLLNVGKCRAA